MVRINNINKKFQSVQAVKDVSFSTSPGQIFGLLGPNGAGKSTTIKMIMNIIAPDSGEILFNDKKLQEKDKDIIGYLPEERGLYKKLKVNEVLLYFASLKNCKKTDAQKNIDYWLEKFDLMKWKQKKVDELSKGMSQKIQFIASIAHDPQILFFDEPFSGLDPVSADTLKEAIMELGANGKTILFSTHIMDQAEKLCSQIMILNKGQEIVSGSLDSIKEKHGKQSIALEFDGNGGFIKDLEYVNNVIEYPRFIELELTSSDYSSRLLKDVCDKIKIKRFESQAPSLHKIFIDIVGNIQEESADE